MTRRLAILTEIISPYRIPLFNALAANSEVNPHVIFLSETDPSLRQWKVYTEEIKFSQQVLPSWRRRYGRYNVLLNRGLARALSAESPDAILCGGYSYVASWQAQLWARSRNIPFLLWSESNLQDARRGYALVEMMKAEFLRRCDGFVVPGTSALEYLRAHKLREDRIFIAPNAVDNDLFSRAAAMAQKHSAEYRHDLDLPPRYFLFVGRLVREKGVFDLLSAYARLNDQLREEFGLVFVGDGSCRELLQQQAAAVSPGVIKFAGFAQREQLAAYYALAEMLVLPTYTDTWGLVVNEAMASGLPVIVSSVAGCAADLVRPDWNGLLVPPGNVSALTSALTALAGQTGLRVVMGARSAQHISQYSPGEWSAAIVRAVHSTVT
ncbi:MAG TPA: glycosyltransferase family 4 protein [Candidatus Dormibacteraeota bacterium]|nr:glycosyltransferase family 4 protein [Candidatus Dormibacteraeota bacterium]